MSSLIGHALGGVVAAQTAAGKTIPAVRRRFYLVMALTSLLPDLDVLVFLLFKPLEITPHRGATHSLLFAAGIALVLTFACARFFALAKERLFGCLFAAYCSHPILDYLMGSGPEIPFLWPFYDRGFLSPVQLVPTAYYGLSSDAVIDVFLRWDTYAGVALELAIFVPLLFLPRAGNTSQRRDLLMLAVAGVAATALL